MWITKKNIPGAQTTPRGVVWTRCWWWCGKEWRLWRLWHSDSIYGLRPRLELVWVIGVEVTQNGAWPKSGAEAKIYQARKRCASGASRPQENHVTFFTRQWWREVFAFFFPATDAERTSLTYLWLWAMLCMACTSSLFIQYNTQNFTHLGQTATSLVQSQLFFGLHE